MGICFTGTGTTPPSAVGGGNAESRRGDSLCRPADWQAFRWGAAAAGARAGTGQKPRLLLLDEPLANLDLRNQIAIPQLVAKLARANAATVLLVTHDINPLLPVVDRVIYIAKGKMVIGKPEEVITSRMLSRLYDAPVQVVKDINGRLFVVGLEQETGIRTNMMSINRDIS